MGRGVDLPGTYASAKRLAIRLSGELLIWNLVDKVSKRVMPAVDARGLLQFTLHRSVRHVLALDVAGLASFKP